MTPQRAIHIGILAILIGTTIGPSIGGAGQIAASIEYEVTPRPAAVPESFQGGPALSLQFLTIKAIDGFRVDAALWQPSNKQPASTPLIVMALGDNNYYSPPQSTLGRGLAEKGYATLAINTRNHDGDIYSHSFFDLRNDIDAAVRTAWALGYHSLVLQGHSQGNIHVQFFEPYMLLGAAHSEGALVTSVKYVMLPNTKPPSPQAHYFIGNEQPLINVVAGWLAEQHL
jgi:hypothetical protein